MKVIVKPITRAIDLADYAPEIVREDGTPALVHVWVNPPADMLDEHTGLVALADAAKQALAEAVRLSDPAEREAALGLASKNIAAVGGNLAEWYAKLFSQHADPATHWTADEVRALASLETDPALYGWLTGRARELIGEHRSARQKK